ncbi:hypothetical protein [Microbacterium testaceum]|uniref:hypothetical protein n=1 Tax=Microbacterium testaceum TaxID=2033 RepID=UPI00124808CC|nr:hypothetical protein [Microbacterium testaceum]
MVGVTSPERLPERRPKRAADDGERLGARHERVEAIAEEFAGIYPTNYLEDLRREWAAMTGCAYGKNAPSKTANGTEEDKSPWAKIVGP